MLRRIRLDFGEFNNARVAQKGFIAIYFQYNTTDIVNFHFSPPKTYE